MAIAAQKQRDLGTGDTDFYAAKIATGRHFMQRHLPATGMLLKRIESGAETVMELDAAHF